MTEKTGIRLRAMTGALLWAIAAPAIAQETGDLERLRQEALDLTNAARAEVGLAELDPADVLDEAAQDHAVDMLERDFYDHVTPEGETPFDRFTAAGGSRWAVSGENIATCAGCTTPPDADRVRAFHQGWMQSPGHRENILSEGFDSFGFGIAGEEEEIYAVQTFSGPGANPSDGGDPETVTPEAARDAALEEVNRARSEAGLAALEASEALDIVAERLLETVAEDADTMPDDVFGLLPEGSSGWTSLALRSASRGGSGAGMTRGDVATFIADWSSSAETDSLLGGTAASRLGFAAQASGNGRKTAVAVFGGRE